MKVILMKCPLFIFILKSVSGFRFSMGVELSKLKEIYKENAYYTGCT